MKELFLLLLAGLLLFDVSLARADAAADWTLPTDSSRFDAGLAMKLLLVANGHTAPNTAAQLQAAGFETLLQVHYDKADTDVSHSCAFTLGRRMQGEQSLYLLVIRGTNAGEWFSNFDFAPSGKDEAVFAENFLYCAQDVLLQIEPYVTADPAAIWMVTGHSRGAACANLLGILLNGLRDPALNYIYTSATPTTLRQKTDGMVDSNIFNLVNPLDLVPRLPLSSWGFGRAGTDIVLPTNAEKAAAMDEVFHRLEALCPTIRDYYETRHLLTAAGTGEKGLTLREVFMIFGQSLCKLQLSSTEIELPQAEGANLSAISAESDYRELADLLSRFGNDASIWQQHMPDVYVQLLQALTASSAAAN